MSVEREAADEGFFRRWSRVKAEARDSAEAPAVSAAAPAESQAGADDAPPVLPPLEELTLDSDYRAFFHPKVDENLRRNALRKLFSDPHFNVMDGLDVYIDDYSKSEPIPAAMLAGLKQAQRILEWAADDQRRTAAAAEEHATAADGAGTADAAEAPLRLDTQPDAEPQAPDLHVPRSAEELVPIADERSGGAS